MQECNCIVIDDKKDFAGSAMMTNLQKRARDNNQLQINLIQLNPKIERYRTVLETVNSSNSL
jgi:hypothetical protein